MNYGKILAAIRIGNGARVFPSKHGGFVGGVYDSSLNRPDDDLPVALIVGINYGQIPTSGSVVGKITDNIGYAAKVPEIVTTIKGPPTHHTIIWNFFPYLTPVEWLEVARTSTKEAQMLFTEGWEHPIEAFELLHKALQPDVLIFHGITSAVPLLARLAIQRVGGSGILTANLSRPYRADKRFLIP